MGSGLRLGGVGGRSVRGGRASQVCLEGVSILGGCVECQFVCGMWVKLGGGGWGTGVTYRADPWPWIRAGCEYTSF